MSRTSLTKEEVGTKMVVLAKVVEAMFSSICKFNPGPGLVSYRTLNSSKSHCSPDSTSEGS